MSRTIWKGPYFNICETEILDLRNISSATAQKGRATAQSPPVGGVGRPPKGGTRGSGREASPEYDALRVHLKGTPKGNLGKNYWFNIWKKANMNLIESPFELILEKLRHTTELRNVAPHFTGPKGKSELLNVVKININKTIVSLFFQKFFAASRRPNPPVGGAMRPTRVLSRAFSRCAEAQRGADFSIIYIRKLLLNYLYNYINNKNMLKGSLYNKKSLNTHSVHEVGDVVSINSQDALRIDKCSNRALSVRRNGHTRQQGNAQRRDQDWDTREVNLIKLLYMHAKRVSPDASTCPKGAVKRILNRLQQKTQYIKRLNGRYSGGDGKFWDGSKLIKNTLRVHANVSRNLTLRKTLKELTIPVGDASSNSFSEIPQLLKRARIVPPYGGPATTRYAKKCASAQSVIAQSPAKRDGASNKLLRDALKASAFRAPEGGGEQSALQLQRKRNDEVNNSLNLQQEIRNRKVKNHLESASMTEQHALTGLSAEAHPIGKITRSSTILPSFIGYTFLVHDGKEWKLFKVKNYHVGYKFGSFIFTKKSAIFKKTSSTGAERRRRA